MNTKMLGLQILLTRYLVRESEGKKRYTQKDQIQWTTNRTF